MTESVVVTVNNLMSVDEEELAKAAEDGSTNRVVQSLETQLHSKLQGFKIKSIGLTFKSFLDCS